MKILLPVDGSEVSLKAVRFAIELIRQGLQADVVLANVQDPVSLYEMVMAPDPQVLESVSEGAGAYLLEGAEALLKQAGVVYECESRLGGSGAHHHRYRRAVGCDMVLMGSHGKGSLRSALLARCRRPCCMRPGCR